MEVKIVNSLQNKFLPMLKHYFYFYIEILSHFLFFFKKLPWPSIILFQIQSIKTVEICGS